FLNLSPSIQPPPPPYQLFPYTTLFRSPRRLLRHRRSEHLRAAGGVRLGECPPRVRRGSRPGTLARRGARIGRRGAGLLRGARRADRKSTRLNSSHVKISYAVFCLKKKK